MKNNYIYGIACGLSLIVGSLWFSAYWQELFHGTYYSLPSLATAAKWLRKNREIIGHT